ncbi:hypothetical protein N0V83_003817 [Neocucurbitaria cava]|uniref:Uncharacterized protein n=1 Tax=Neocucurbitaria cava TaxID=798079 RepID=A0A9W8YBN5_9PLEO|nr:hypothetical protein N0V83_003817 [Neocucurbitaria cava]
MHATTTLAAVLAFATSALAGPVSVKLDSRDPNNFRLYSVHQHQNTCAVDICQTIDNYYVNVADDCNGGGCNAKESTLPWDDSYCNADFPVCDRTLQLVSRGDGDCGKLSDLSASNNGQPYATITENGVDVGTCSVDFSRHYSRTCGALGGGFEFQSHVYCAFF